MVLEWFCSEGKGNSTTIKKKKVDIFLEIEIIETFFKRKPKLKTEN